MKKQLTQSERIQIAGLIAIAAQHRRVLETCQRALEEIIGEPPDSGGHASDFIWSDEGDHDFLISKIGAELVDGVE